MTDPFIARLLLDRPFRVAAYRDSLRGASTVLGPEDTRRAVLQRLSPARLQSMSERIDRELVRAVLMGRPPDEGQLLAEAVRHGINKEGAMPESDLPRALWRTVHDDAFRRACFGNARRALEDAGYVLTDEELGKFRWFDQEKLATLGETIAALTREEHSDCDDGASPAAPDAASAEEIELRRLHGKHARQVDAVRARSRELLADSPAYAPGEFDPGPPPPPLAEFAGILQLLRWHGWDLNAVLRDSGYSLGRLMILLRELPRSGLELTEPDRTIETEPDTVAAWLTNAFRAPSMDERFHQSPCDPSAVVGRVAHIARTTWLRGREVLVLGDDDGISLVLARHTEARVHVVDIDERVLAALDASARRAGLELTLHHRDLRDELPADLVGRFALVSADPPQSERGERFFLERAVDAIVPEPGHRIYCSITPMWMGLMAFGAVIGHMSRLGFASRDVLKSQMTFSVRRQGDERGASSRTQAILDTAMTGTLNMGCDVHVFERTRV